MKIKEIYLGSKFYMKGVFEGVIKDDTKSKKLYKKLGLPIFEEVEPKIKKDAVKKESSK
jgi:hypothetical protein